MRGGQRGRGRGAGTAPNVTQGSKFLISLKVIIK